MIDFCPEEKVGATFNFKTGYISFVSELDNPYSEVGQILGGCVIENPGDKMILLNYNSVYFKSTHETYMSLTYINDNKGYGSSVLFKDGTRLNDILTFI